MTWYTIRLKCYKLGKLHHILCMAGSPPASRAQRLSQESAEHWSRATQVQVRLKSSGGKADAFRVEYKGFEKRAFWLI